MIVKFTNATELNLRAMKLCFVILLIGIIQCAYQINLDSGLSSQSRIDQSDVSNSSVPLMRTDQTKVDYAVIGGGQQRSNSSSAAHRLSSRILFVLKLLQLYKTYSAKHNSTSFSRRNGTVFDSSETRSLPSWFRIRRPIQRQGSSYLFERTPLFNSDYEPNGRLQPFIYPALSDSTFYRQPTTPSTNPNSYLLVPPLSDSVGIDYWLKLIDNASIEEGSIPFTPEKEKIYIKHKPSFKRVKSGRNKNKNRYQNGFKTTLNTKNEDSTPLSDADDNFDQNMLFNNDINQDSKSSSAKMPKVIEYDTSPRCDKFTDEICIDDFEYPEHAILDEIYKRKDLFQLMYSEVKGDAPLVDGIPRDVEENFSQDYYYNNNDNQESEDYDGYGNYNANRTLHNDQSKQTSVKRDKQTGGFVCLSEVLYAKPKLARNIKGKWRVIVNAGDFTQTLRMEKCTKPNHECRFISEHKYDSRCAQISSIHRLLVFEKGKGFYIDTFRIPTACTCHVIAPKYKSKKHSNNYSGESSDAVTLSVKKDKSKSKLGETLWTILGTHPDSKDIHRINLQNVNNNNDNNDHINNANNNNQQNNNHNNNNNLYQLSDQSKTPINLDLIKLLPHLTSIPPEIVLQQLLESYSNEGSPHQNFQSSGNNKQIVPDFHMIDLADRFNSNNNKKNSIHTYLLSNAQRENDDIIQDRTNKVVTKQFSYSQPGTTTIVTPPRSGNNNAPIVQVIHVPVTSSIAAQENSGDSGLSDYSRPIIGRNRLHPSIYLQYLNGIKQSNSNADSYDLLGNSKYSNQLISASNHLMQMHSKTNTTVASPPFRNQTKIQVDKEFMKPWLVSKLEANINNTNNNNNNNNNNNINRNRNHHKDNNKDIKNSMNKKMNFSYHPILEYLVN